MAHLKKIGRYYYIRYHFSKNGSRTTVAKSLGTRYKDIAQKMLRDLDYLEDAGEINPLSPGFDPVQAYKEMHEPKETCETLREAANLYYKKKQHLSPKTIDTYKRAIEHFLELNNIGGSHPGRAKQEHAENVILKPGISPATRHFYYRQLRAWWNWLFENEIVKRDIINPVRKDLPPIREQTRPKMMNEDEFKKLFNVFDEELARKKELPEYDPDLMQHWFKPLMAVYFYAGLRRSEAAFTPNLDYSGLKGESLIYEDGALEYIYLGPTKGRKERLVPLQKELITHLETYLKKRGRPGPDEYLFIYTGGSSQGNPVTGERAYDVLKHYMDLAGIPKTRTIHGMRHQAITSWIEGGISTPEAAFLAGHSTQRVTEKYTHLTAKRLKEKMDKIN